jgi:NitT/TauT family transport system substrate-binding protein
MTANKLYARTIVAFLVVTSGSSAACAEPLLVASATWVGNGPLFIAQERGLFADEGLEVEVITMEEGGLEAVLDGQVDAVVQPLDSTVAKFDPDEEAVCVLVLDESLGGDGIVARNDIRDIGDLKGKTVAFFELSSAQFFLNVLLLEAGLSATDIVPLPMTAPDAAEAFMLGEVDAAATWEPWLTEAASTEHGHLLADSSERPGLIADCLVAKRSVFEARKGDFQALARGWAAAVDFFEAHPQEAIETMARHVGGWLEDPAAFAETLEGVRIYGGEANQAYFGTAQNPGPIYDTAQKAIDVWSTLGVLKADISPADTVGHGIWDR